MKQIAIAADQFFNAILGGYADETISARLYRNRNRSWWWRFWHKAVNLVFFWQPAHCFEAYISEVNRKQLPKEYQLQQRGNNA